jgi:hypothetical protein
MLVLIAGESMLFAGLIGMYLVIRLSAQTWPPAGQPRLPLLVTTLNTLLLFGSLVPMTVALRAVARDDRARTARALLVTTGLGVLFLPAALDLWRFPVWSRPWRGTAFLTFSRTTSATSPPVPCAMFARAGLGVAGVRIGSKSITMFGISAQTFDRLLEEVDGYVVADRGGDARNAVQRFARILERRPGVLYPALTTAAFAIQSPPLQHSIFAFLPQDVVIVPVALRGSHDVWPKCPRGNLRINPGLVEVVVAPPMLGEITLLPRRRSLRIQVEAAALFQAVHLTTLLNPAPSDS